MLARPYPSGQADRTNRLRTRAEFDRVFAVGRAAHGKLLSVRAADADRAKAGFTVGKTVSLKATDRNRVRRRLREIIRGLDLAAVEIVVSAKRPATRAGSDELRTELEGLLKQAGALR
jgi:ribonuclease P protein component